MNPQVAMSPVSESAENAKGTEIAGSALCVLLGVVGGSCGISSMGWALFGGKSGMYLVIQCV